MFSEPYSIYFFSVITCFFIIWYCTNKMPLIPVWGLITGMVNHRWILWLFVLMYGVLFMNKQELRWENIHPMSYDITPLFFNIEGNAVHWFQSHFESLPLTYTLTYFYVIFMLSMLISLIIILHFIGDIRALKALFYGITLNYLVAIPFYIFVPVNEVWASGHGLSFLIPQVYPGFETQYRGFSGLNNCFPSLHTSLSVTMLLITLRSKSKKGALLAAINAVFIIFGIFYLGIHWILDSVGGVLLAAISSFLGYKISNKTSWGVDKS